MAGQPRIGEASWTALLVLWGLALFFAVGFIGAARSLGCDDDCARGEDWGWLALAISSLLGLGSMLLLVLLGWVLKGHRRRFLAFASVAMLVASIVGVVALFSLDDGRGAEGQCREVWPGRSDSSARTSGVGKAVRCIVV